MATRAAELDDRNQKILWLAAIAVAALGTWLMYDAEPGINWGIWTACAAALLHLFVRFGDRRPVLITGTSAVVIAFGASVTADPLMLALVCFSVIMFMALSMLLAVDPRFDRITAAFAIPAPVVAFTLAIVEAARRAVHALHVVRSNRARSVVQGIAITLPVVAVFALLLSTADPLFADWREAIGRVLATWDFLPRTIFFFGLLTIVLGAYGFAAAEQSPAAATRPGDTTQRRWLGATERLILLTSVAVLFWLFLVIQLSYLFGTSPQIAGSGLTFADYARRGFGELTVLASASILLILFCDRFAETGNRRGLLRTVTIAVILAVFFLLASAFNRVSLYEQAYGYTTARLYAQAYMLVVAVVLVALTVEVRGEVQPSRLFRRAVIAVTVALIVLVYWNHHAWIANRNIDRHAATGKLDAPYLVRELSLDAVPTIVKRLRALPEPARTELRNVLEVRYRGRHRMFEGQWYEWNAHRSAAAVALREAGVALDYQAPARTP